MFRWDFHREVRLNPLFACLSVPMKQVVLERGFESEGEQESTLQRNKNPSAVIPSLPPCHLCDSARHSFGALVYSSIKWRQ